MQKERDKIIISITGNENEKSNLIHQLNQVRLRIQNYNNKKKEIHEQFGIDCKNIPDENLWAAFTNDKETFHICKPWSSIKINKLRSEMFLKSLSLHEYAILSNARAFKQNIDLLMFVLDNKEKVDKETALNLWQTFFFCIPVISTSLASVSKLFGSLGKESIGWLLMDEAGQATPQSAAGIIYRSKRSIIIGDPLQIEPVVTIPPKLVTLLAKVNQIKDAAIWSPLNSSAQILADRVTNKGTLMRQNDEADIWAGFPLRTHNRCNNPMFTISNQISYNGQMVKGKDDENFACVLGDSVWFDVEGLSKENNQVIEAEIELLIEKIKELENKQEEIFVISPFNKVANKCRERLNEIIPSIKVNCGTIHNFQGKEADIVFLVLGSNPSKKGSREWASKKSNMLNVALTRAKKRFYVIGSKKCWKDHNFFNQLAEKL